MSETYNTKAIVLQYSAWRECDRIYRLYTEQYGKVVARAQGVKKLLSKLAGNLEPFAEIDLFLIKAKTMPKIGGAVTMRRFDNLRISVSNNQAAWFCCDLVDQLTKEGVPDMDIYRLLYSVLVWINHQGQQRLILFSYVVKLINLLGYRLQANNQVSGNVEINKIILWLQQQTYNEIQKLRLTDRHWRGLLQSLQTWLTEHDFKHVQTEFFLL